MNYTDTVQWLFSQLPMYQNQGKSAYKKDLSNSIKLAEHLGNPETKFKSIHVAGTNGKGSTCHILASILQEAGYKVGLYTSPHLKEFTERIKINGKQIEKQYVVDFVETNKTFLETNRLSFFEMTVGLAFNYFADKKVDIAIIETGLGGRLDSTNIITPEVSVITNIGYDHMDMLGDTLAKIAYEKAGVIKDNIPVIIGERNDETSDVFIRKAAVTNSKISFVHEHNIADYASDLKGMYQGPNIKTAVMTIKVLRETGFEVAEENVVRGIKNVTLNTDLKGRWQILNHNPKIICDTAHNREGLEYVLDQLQNESFDELHIVVGFVKDKNIDSIVDLFPKNAVYYFCQAKVQRAMNAMDLKKVFSERQLVGEAYQSVQEALNTAINNAKTNDLIFVGGSTYVVAEVV